VNCCTARCGWCGRCEDALLESPPFEVDACDRCGKTLGLLTGKISLQGVGIACSRRCMDTLVAQHERAMQWVSA
jgi:hypothetical protein